MDITQICEMIGNIGLPAVIIVYLMWRFDKFLTRLGNSMEKYNQELGSISAALVELVAYTKGLAKQGYK